MKKKIFTGYLKSAVTLVLISAVFCSCSASKSDNGRYYESENAKAYDISTVVEEYAEAPMEMEIYSDDGFQIYSYANEISTTGDGESVENPVSDVTAERKIIYSSSYSIQTKNFDDSLKALDTLCKKYGAYTEKSNIYSTDGMARNAHYTLRVPSANYTAFTGETGTIGVVTGSSQDNRDITENYYDTEARLENAKIREERVLEILKNSSDLDDVLALERELSDIRYEIESYTGTLRKYDSLISYSTVTVSISEVREYVAPKTEPVSFGERLNSAFKNGIYEFKTGCQDFLVFVSYNLIPIVIWLLIIAAVVLLVIKVRHKKKKKACKTSASESETEDKENK